MICLSCIIRIRGSLWKRMQVSRWLPSKWVTEHFLSGLDCLVHRLHMVYSCIWLHGCIWFIVAHTHQNVVHVIVDILAAYWLWKLASHLAASRLPSGWVIFNLFSCSSKQLHNMATGKKSNMVKGLISLLSMIANPRLIWKDRGDSTKVELVSFWKDYRIA